MWKPNSKVKYISSTGRESIKTISVTDEGFASIKDNGEEFLFDNQGRPINSFFNSDTGGPSIYQVGEDNGCSVQNKRNYKKTTKFNRQHKQILNNKGPNYLNATDENPWDNAFVLKKLTIYQLKLLLDEFVKIGYGNKKLHLKNFGECATLDDKEKIKKSFIKIRCENNIVEE